VQDFLANIPVRKQTALKTAAKTLEAIRNLLFSFAFARPEVRFSLKVLKGKHDKVNWTYAATPSRSLAEAATKIVGKEVSSILTEHAIVSDDCDVNVGAGWNINAVLVSGSAGI
jgi:DNA mismatch repair ATPase MutL